MMTLVTENGYYAMFLDASNSDQDCSINMFSESEPVHSADASEQPQSAQSCFTETSRLSAKYGRMMWLRSGVRVRVSTVCGDDVDWSLNPRHRCSFSAPDGPSPGSDLLPPPAFLGTKKPFCCSICFRTMKKSSDVLNHLRDQHVRDTAEPLQCPFQDEYVAIIVKPQGIPVMGKQVSDEINLSNLV